MCYHGMAVVDAVTRLLPEPGCSAFSVCAEQFQDPAINVRNCSCSSYLQFPVSPETRGAKRKHFRKSPASSHCIQKSPFLPPPLSSFLQVCCWCLVTWLLQSLVFASFSLKETVTLVTLISCKVVSGRQLCWFRL